MTTLQTLFDEQNQNEAWRNKVAQDLNWLLSRAQYFKETSNDESDQATELATLRIVERVREFEEIKTVEDLKPARYPRRKPNTSTKVKI